jgi:hypothetical protein
MLAKVLDGGIDPTCIEQAARAVNEELIPQFVAHPGAEQAFWMVEPRNGHVLAVTMWSGPDAVAECAAADGAERAAVAERIGLRVRAVTVLPVLGIHLADQSAGGPSVVWGRVTWVEGVRPERRAATEALHDQIVLDQGRSDGFRASFWIGDVDRGEGFALSLWATPADLHGGALASRRRRRRVTRALGCRVGAVHQYRALGVTARAPEHGRIPPAVAGLAAGPPTQALRG